MRRDPSHPLSCCSTTVLDLFVPFWSGPPKEAMPLGCEDSWFDELKFKAPSVVLVDERANGLSCTQSFFEGAGCGDTRMLR